MALRFLTDMLQQTYKLQTYLNHVQILHKDVTKNFGEKEP